MPRTQNKVIDPLYEKLKRYAELIYDSNSIPNASSFIRQGDTRDQTIARIMLILYTGHEHGISPSQSLAEISLIQNIPYVSAKLKLALIFRDIKTAEIVYDEISKTRCILRAKRHPNHAFTKIEYTMEEATRAGLPQKNKNTWNYYQKQMLLWHCVNNMARILFPDVIFGCYVSDGKTLYQNQFQQGVSESAAVPLPDLDVPDGVEENEVALEVANEYHENTSITQPNEGFVENTISEDNLSPKEIYESTIPQSDVKKQLEGLELKLDLPEHSPKKIILKPKILPPVVVKPPEQKVDTPPPTPPTPAKPTAASALSKIKAITKKKEEIPTPISNQTPKLMVRTAKKDFKTFKNGDYYGSYSTADKLGSDLPWNILKDAITAVINSTEFKTEISKLFRDLQKEATVRDTNAEILIKAYHKYCGLKGSEQTIDLEAVLDEKIAIVLEKIYSILIHKGNSENSIKFFHDLIESIGLIQPFQAWLENFLVSREWISLENNMTTSQLYIGDE